MIDTPRFHSSRSGALSTDLLIDDVFTPSEAKDIVFGMLNAAINAYKLRNLRSQIHTESNDKVSSRKIEELEERRERLRALFLAERREQLRLRLDTSLQLEIEDAALRR